MGLNHKQAEFYAPQLHHYTKTVEPRLTVGGIINELKNVLCDDPVVILAAAWATVAKMRRGEYQAFSKLGEEVVNHFLSGQPTPADPTPQFKPLNQPAPQPFNPRREARCEWHPESARRNCSACRAEWLAGDISEKEYRGRQNA